MRHLRMLGLMLLAALAFGSYAAASASATEPGLLTLEGKSETVEIKAGEGKNPELVTAAGSIKCTKLHPTTASATGAHIDLFNKVTLNFLGCKEETPTTKVSCRSEDLKGAKDALETILVLADFHLVDLLNGASLEPGIAVILLDPNTEAEGNVKIKCGVVNIEVRGVVKGLVLASLAPADIKEGTIDFSKTFDKCDTSDKLCLKLEEKLFEANVGGKFEAATQITEVPFTTNIMVLVDD